VSRASFIAALLWSSLGVWAGDRPSVPPLPPSREHHVSSRALAYARGGWIRPDDHVDVRVGELTLRDVVVGRVGPFVVSWNVDPPDGYPPPEVTLNVTAEEAELLRFAFKAGERVELTLRDSR
jgi:hypothetical protein